MVFYVTSAEFDRFTSDLHQLAERTSRASLGSLSRVSELRDRAVIGLLERRIVSSRLLDPLDLQWLRDAPRRRWWR